MNITNKDVWKVFWWGVEYGQLLMEEERKSEEMFDAAVCYQSGLKYGVPSSPIQRRQLHSDKWFAAKRKGYKNFLEYYALLHSETEHKKTTEKQKQFVFDI
jgi:hypothetical protein